MAKLSDDLILNIISRLPRKDAVRCSTLSKTFKQHISSAEFARQHALLWPPSSSKPVVFHCSAVKSKSATRIDPSFSGSDPISTTLPIGISVLASCNGLLLARIDCYDEYQVLNPTTGRKIIVDHRISRGHDDIGLAVDLDDATKYPFKLVTLDVNPNATRFWSSLGFTVIVPSPIAPATTVSSVPSIIAATAGPTTVVKSEVVFTCQKFARMLDRNTRPVYAHGCLHWIGDDATKIVAFDVEKEKPRMINGPMFIKTNEDFDKDDAGGKWFGFAQGSLQFIHSSRQQIVIRKHDHPNDVWQVSDRIANICSSPRSRMDSYSGTPLFFDGQRLIMQLGKEIYMQFTCSGEWEKKGQEIGCGDEIFFEFFPTLARVSDEHRPRGFRWEDGSFYALQWLLRDSYSA